MSEVASEIINVYVQAEGKAAVTEDAVTEDAVAATKAATSAVADRRRGKRA